MNSIAVLKDGSTRTQLGKIKVEIAVDMESSLARFYHWKSVLQDKENQKVFTRLEIPDGGPSDI